MTATADQDERLAALMRSAQDGDARAYAALLSEVAPLIRRALRRRLGFLQPQDVEDLVQDVLLSLHAARSTYDPGRPFLPWLMAIARNRVTDAIVPAVAMVVMLRRGAPLYPRATLALGALAVAAISNLGVQVFHVHDASVVLLVWHLGGVAVLSLLAAALGNRLLRWRHGRAVR